VLQLQSRKKWTASGTSRIRPVQETLDKVIPLSRKIGVTRLADITDMDILRIPNYSAVLPGTEDYIWVYSGKGPTRKHAMASALMESIERYSSLPRGGPHRFVRSSYADLSEKHKVLHPDEIIEPLRFAYRNDMVMDWLAGYDIISDEEVLVPASIALFRYNPNPPAINPFAYFHTNGLASGNVIEEAVCHALCEVIERDAMSIAELRASAIPFHILRAIVHSLNTNKIPVAPIPAERFIDDPGVFPEVDISQVDFEPARKLEGRFKRAGIPLMIKDITSDIGIPTFSASSVEWVAHDYGYLAEGHGTHPDARIALLRAITEVSQTRAANIQGARDDLRKIKYSEISADDKRAWQFMPSTRKIKFSELHTFFNEDILDDIQLIISKLKHIGLDRVIIVDLTNSEIEIPVVRAIVPGLETFKITKSIMGRRARACFRQWTNL
jgi:thioglycine synthase